MRSNKHLFAVCVLVAAGVRAQTSPVTSAITITADGQATLTIRNNSPTSAVAYVLTSIYTINRGGKTHRITTRVFRDSATTRTQKPIIAGESSSFPVGPRGATDLTGSARAGIFEDGSYFGDPQWVAIMVTRRQSYASALNTVVGELKTAVAANTPQNALAGEFRQALAQSQATWKVIIDGDTSAAQAVGGLGAMLEEPSQAAKSANLKTISDQEQLSAMQQIYTFVIKNLTTSPKWSDNGAPLTPSETINTLVALLTEDQARLTAAKAPTLP